MQSRGSPTVEYRIAGAPHIRLAASGDFGADCRFRELLSSAVLRIQMIAPHDLQAISSHVASFGGTVIELTGAIPKFAGEPEELTVFGQVENRGRRIVFDRVVLAEFDDESVSAVIGHELGHVLEYARGNPSLESMADLHAERWHFNLRAFRSERERLGFSPDYYDALQQEQRRPVQHSGPPASKSYAGARQVERERPQQQNAPARPRAMTMRERARAAELSAVVYGW
jgi:hypothetical protein